MSKKKFIQERLEKLEDINEFFFKGGLISSTGEYTMSDITYNLLPILKDIIDENIELKIKIGQLEGQVNDFATNVEKFKRIGFEGLEEPRKEVKK